MPVRNNSQRCPHCEKLTSQYFDDDGVLTCFVCRKAIHTSFKKFCQTCNRMVEFTSQSMMHGDSCNVCGDMVHGEPIPYTIVNEGESDDCESISIIPAWEIYRQHRGAESKFVHDLYYEFNFQFLNSQSKQVKMQAWQYVKACVRLLKEMNRWITWQDFEPDSEGWRAWWAEHPEDREDMAGHLNQSATMANRAQELMVKGMAPDDVREQIRKESISGGTF